MFWRFFLVFMIGCGRYGIDVNHFVVDRSYLPSTFVGSNDPLQQQPFAAEIILIHYNLKENSNNTPIEGIFEAFFQDLSYKTFVFSLDNLKGTKQLEIGYEDLQQRGPILAYRVAAGDMDVKSPMFCRIFEIDGRKIQIDPKVSAN
jgi:hypothetical protein